MYARNSLVTEQRIAPVRGLVLTRNVQGRLYDLVDLKRWMRLNREIYKIEKVDVLLVPERVDALPVLVAQAQSLNMVLSLRTDCAASPEAFGDLAAAGLHDVFLAPPAWEPARVDPWLEACRAAGLAVRLQVQAPFPEGFDPENAAGRIAQAGPAMVNVVFHDPFTAPRPCRNATESRRIVDQMNALVRALAAHGVEANLIGLPFCQVPEENRICAENAPQFFLDHQQYRRASYELAAALYRRSPNTAGKAILIPLGRGKTTTSPVDARLLRWFLSSSRRHLVIHIWRRLARRLRRVRGHPKALEENEQAYLKYVTDARAQRDREMGPVCSQCCLRRICDRETDALRRCLPGLALTQQTGDLVVSPLHFCRGQRKTYDAIDAARVDLGERYLALARHANDVVLNSPPTREIDSSEYEIVGQWTHHMPGGNRWYSFSNTEKLSTVLLRTEPPLTLSVMFGGGIAEFIGFSFGRHSRILCPMESFSHHLVFHVDADGYYVLLRDGKPVRPVEFEDVEYVPVRLAGVLEPRIAIWNIDTALVTQTVQAWEGRPEAAAGLARVKYSVLVVCTRYSRRLQAVLHSIACQQGIDLRKIEVVVGYVPGIDATDDVLDSLRLVHPDLRVVRAPFTEGYVKSKGFVINESVRAASGEWIVLLDADTILAPNMFAKMEEVADTSDFIVPDGRKMLTAETTARVLLGELQPWRDWEALLESPGEYRLREADGVPIGYFQCVRKTCMKKVQYMELDHFEGADWWFGYHMRENFGQETRLSGVPVLHLEHGGSQWYGTQKQR